MTAANAARLEAFLHELTRPVCDALVVVSGDTTLVNWRSGRVNALMETMSMTKSIVSMTVGRLLREGLLEDIDMPLAKVLPAWRGTPKERITLRHVMSHTSGLDASHSSETAFASGNVVDFALGLELVSEPGAAFAYNNCAVNLLSSVVATTAGRPLDEVASEMIFKPLGIASWQWRRDASGTPLAMSGCGLEPRDVALLGELMARGGTWNGRELLTSEWCRLSTAPVPPASGGDLQRYLRMHGLLWWVLYPRHESLVIDDDVVRAWREAEPPLDASLLGHLAQLSGRAFDSDGLLAAVADVLRPVLGDDRDAAMNAWHQSTWQRGLPDARRLPGTEIGFFAQGARGQYLLVEPQRRLVVVQMVGESSVPSDATALLQAATRLIA